MGVANTIIGNAALWSMLLAPIAIKAMGKRNLLITANSINIVILLVLYLVYDNLLLICVLWYINTFINTFWNIVQHNVSADMRDYHQWKTGVRVDGLFGPLGMIDTVIGLFTGLVYPAIYEKMGLLEDYDVLYNDAIRNNLFEVLILCSAVGALLNLIPFCFYDLTENKHRAYVAVLKIRAMFENHALGVLEDHELEEAMQIIHQAKQLFGKEKQLVDKSALKAAKRLPHKDGEEKQIRAQAIKAAKTERRNAKETNLAIERAAIIMEDLSKFSGEAGRARLAQAHSDYAGGKLCFYENAYEELKAAKKLPKKTKTEKEIRSDAIKNARMKKESASLLKRCGIENITAPDESVKEEIINGETHGFFESMKLRQELRAYLKAASVYERVTKPYTNAQSLITQANSYTYYEELEEIYRNKNIQESPNTDTN